MLFKILSIQHGWFEVDFNRQFILVNSDYLGCDAPALLLEAIASFLEKKTDVQWLCFQGEPGVYIVRIECEDNRLLFEVYDTEEEAWNLEYQGETLSQYITKCLYRTEADRKEAAESIYSEFELYENGNGRKRYEYHWGSFPQQAFERLKELLAGESAGT